MIEPQAVGVRVILSCELLIVDLRELKRCKQKHDSSKIMCTFFMDVLPHTLGLHDPPDQLRCVLTLSRPREQHLGLQPDRPVSVHHRGGRGVRQTHEILPLLLLNAARGQTDIIVRLGAATRGPPDSWSASLALWMSSGITYLRTSG